MDLEVRGKRKGKWGTKGEFLNVVKVDMKLVVMMEEDEEDRVRW